MPELSPTEWFLLGCAWTLLIWALAECLDIVLNSVER